MNCKKDLEFKKKKEKNAYDVKITGWICLSICSVIGLITTKDVTCLSILLLGLFI